MADEDLDRLISSLSLEEKVSLLAGSSMWSSTALDDKGVRSIKVQQLIQPKKFRSTD